MSIKSLIPAFSVVAMFAGLSQAADAETIYDLTAEEQTEFMLCTMDKIVSDEVEELVQEAIEEFSENNPYAESLGDDFGALAEAMMLLQIANDLCTEEFGVEPVPVELSVSPAPYPTAPVLTQSYSLVIKIADICVYP